MNGGAVARQNRTDELIVSIGQTLYWLDRQLSEAEDLRLANVTRQLEQALLHLGQAKADLHQLSFPLAEQTAQEERARRARDKRSGISHGCAKPHELS
jgi:hypothetical protein